ncbi:MAG: serine/threonine protein kinase, partial [Myxococcales bacterium]|nr:serine/threonine protein kinase [Myxococcales bacterium]
VGSNPLPSPFSTWWTNGLPRPARARWGEAESIFEKIAKIAPGYEDADARAGEVRKWRTAMQGGGRETTHIAGRYRLLGELGRGGMAVVYRAVDESLGREVAVKFIAENVEKNELVAQYFEREAKAAAALNHPNIVTIYDYGIHEGRPFMAMELVVGTTVEDLTAKQGRIVIVDALRIGTQVLSALE